MLDRSKFKLGFGRNHGSPNLKHILIVGTALLGALPPHLYYQEPPQVLETTPPNPTTPYTTIVSPSTNNSSSSSYSFSSPSPPPPAPSKPPICRLIASPSPQHLRYVCPLYCASQSPSSILDLVFVLHVLIALIIFWHYIAFSPSPWVLRGDSDPLSPCPIRLLILITLR
ncbi:hypothetical protein CASFOL_017459 [Castilleja foliolosa]|uniref:Succinate dehydrogenase subunit 3 n=1 Tax=Castilleja foliolosa TaxID=1961234 RepID=A0ABD3DC32_9LAMI